jgi:hypothetical protein
MPPEALRPGAIFLEPRELLAIKPAPVGKPLSRR